MLDSNLANSADLLDRYMCEILKQDKAGTAGAIPLFTLYANIN